MRVTRFFKTPLGKLAIFAEVLNVYDRKNDRGYDISENAESEGDTDYWLPRVPSIGLSWQWEM